MQVIEIKLSPRVRSSCLTVFPELPSQTYSDFALNGEKDSGRREEGEEGVLRMQPLIPSRAHPSAYSAPVKYISRNTDYTKTRHIYDKMI